MIETEIVGPCLVRKLKLWRWSPFLPLPAMITLCETMKRKNVYIYVYYEYLSNLLSNHTSQTHVNNQSFAA